MVANRHITKIIIAVMAAAVALCLCAGAFSGTLAKLLGGTAVKMEYETSLSLDVKVNRKIIINLRQTSAILI